MEPQPRSGEFRKTLSHLSKHIDSSTLEDLKYLSQDFICAAKLDMVKSPIEFFQALEESGKISVNDVSFLADLLKAGKKFHLAEKLAQFMGGDHIMMQGQPEPLPAPLGQFNQYYSHPSAPSFGEHQQQRALYDDAQYELGSLNTIQSSRSSIQVQNQQVLSVPTQVEDDNETGALSTANHLKQLREQRGNLESMRGSMDDAVYQNKLQQLEQREMQYRRELEQKDRQLQEHQKQLQDREDTINQLTRQYEQQLHMLRQVKTESAGEQERLQQQIREYEEMIRQNVAQIETLREENAQMPISSGPGAERYTMNKKPHGIAVIVNNFEFFTNDSSSEALPNRRGSQVDEDNLRITWEFLQYDVRILRNLTATELSRHLMQIALHMKEENCDSFVCCILSHGYLDGVYGTDGKPVKINDIASSFKGIPCPALVNKPKLFFIQACCGEDEDKGVAVQADTKGDKGDALRRSLPSEADFLFGYATPPGNVSWRSPQYGSWYISKLCEVLTDNSHHQDLLSMLTMVNSEVSQAYTTKGYKQCPAPVTLLRRQVWFFPAV